MILTTHFMDEAERLADHVVIIDHGRAVADGSPATLTGSAGQLRFRAEPGLDTDSLLAALPAGQRRQGVAAGHYLIEVCPAAPSSPRCSPRSPPGAPTAPCCRSSLQIESRTLEDVFLELTGRELRVMTAVSETAPACSRRRPAAPDGRRAGRAGDAGSCCATASSSPSR